MVLFLKNVAAGFLVSIALLVSSCESKGAPDPDDISVADNLDDTEPAGSPQHGSFHPPHAIMPPMPPTYTGIVQAMPPVMVGGGQPMGNPMMMGQPIAGQSIMGQPPMMGQPSMMGANMMMGQPMMAPPPMVGPSSMMGQNYGSFPVYPPAMPDMSGYAGGQQSAGVYSNYPDASRQQMNPMYASYLQRFPGYSSIVGAAYK